MIVFPHGIRRAFLGPVGACFGFLLKQDDEAELELQSSFHGQEELEHLGILPPTARGEDEGVDLQLAIKGIIEEDEGCLLLKSGEEEEGILPPTQRGEEDNNAENNDLQLSLNGYEDEGFPPPIGKDEQEGDWQANPKGEFEPTYARKDDDGTLRLPNGATYDGDFLPYFVHSLHVEVMHAEIGGHGKAFMAHDDVVIVHAKPRVDPKVKKKTSLLLCLTIDMPFHPGESSHDGCSPHHHHEPNTLTNESPSPSSRHHTHEPSSSAFFLLVSLSQEDKAVDEVLKDSATSTSMPFTPLRGRKGFQGREWHDEEKTKTKTDIKPKMKLKPTMIKMGLHYLYLNKDLLDPG